MINGDERAWEIIEMVREKGKTSRKNGLRHPLIAFTGYARQGKDTAAEPLIEIGYQQASFGNIIKEQARTITALDVVDMMRWMCETEAELGGNDDERNRVFNAWLAFDRDKIDPFTQVDRDKSLIRALLEWLGMWRYEGILERYLETLPVPCVNTRLMRVPEAQAWLAVGGIIVHVNRNNTPSTPFEQATMQQLEDAHVITHRIENNGTVGDLHRKMMEIAGFCPEVEGR